MVETIALIIAIAVVAVCAALLADAAFGLLRASRGIDDEAVQRRLSQATGGDAASRLLREGEARPRQSVPLSSQFGRLIQQAGSPITMPQALIIAGVVAVLAVVALLLLLQHKLTLLAFPVGVLLGPGAVLLFLVRARAARIARFEEQLPEAIDLVIRSLKVGHPLSVSLSVIARELPPPISVEFAMAYAKVSYGLSVPDAFREMSERVPVADLRYLIAALQIQEEAGGNLIESLTKLSGVIRERFRMFRKVKAITAEGRMSAWLLSAFPFLIAIGIKIVKPDYFDHALETERFPIVAVVTGILLVFNIVVMNAITKIKV
jgi:tight adherence protein B